MSAFWLSSGYLLVDRDADGRLIVTDEFLKLYLARSEVVPPPDACSAELALHARLMASPRGPVTSADIAMLADADARENWQVLISFRDRLIAAGTLEAAYLAMMRDGSAGTTPLLFVNQLVHVILRNVLDSETDATVLRAAELFFRPQRLTTEQGGLLLADEEVLDSSKNETGVSPLAAMLGEVRSAGLDVLSQDNAAAYFERSDAFDMVLNFSPQCDGRAAFARVMERWLDHMLGLTATIAPLDRIEDDAWFWFIGLDAEATRIGNALWTGKTLPAGTLDRVVALFRMELPGHAELSGRSIYLILAADSGHVVRVKPQNLLTGLPDAALQKVSDG